MEEQLLSAGTLLFTFVQFTGTTAGSLDLAWNVCKHRKIHTKKGLWRNSNHLENSCQTCMCLYVCVRTFSAKCNGYLAIYILFNNCKLIKHHVAMGDWQLWCSLVFMVTDSTFKKKGFIYQQMWLMHFHPHCKHERHSHAIKKSCMQDVLLKFGSTGNRWINSASIDKVSQLEQSICIILSTLYENMIVLCETQALGYGDF